MLLKISHQSFQNLFFVEHKFLKLPAFKHKLATHSFRFPAKLSNFASVTNTVLARSVNYHNRLHSQDWNVLIPTKSVFGWVWELSIKSGVHALAPSREQVLSAKKQITLVWVQHTSVAIKYLWQIKGRSVIAPVLWLIPNSLLLRTSEIWSI